MRAIIAVLAFAFMIPAAQADEEDRDNTPPPVGGICIQSVEGQTVCL